MQQDSYVLGCTLFENGDPGGWSSFDLEPVALWLKNYLLPPSALPPAPLGLSAVAGTRVVTLSWSNPPITPTTWSVKRSTNSGGPWLTIATNITTGVQATTYTDSSLINFTTYYYVASAVNALGESSNSLPVSATPALPIPTAINCGGPAAGSFLADIYYDIGTAFATGTAIDTTGVLNPAPMVVYQSQRYGNVTYTLPYLTPNTSYNVRLHFAEIYWTAPAQRRFNVLLNGVQVLSNFDIFSAAGASFKANIQSFNAISDKSGVIRVKLVTVTDNASINGLEISVNPTNTIPASPANLAAVVGNALVTLTWSVPSGATSFSLKRSTASGGPYSIIASNLSTPTWRDAFFVPSTTYYYVVSALNSLGESPDSAQTSARPTNGLPDLVVTAVGWTPANLWTGTNIVFNATVQNRGSASTASGAILGVGFNVDGTGTASWSTTYSSALAPNASVTLTADGGPAGTNYWPATAGPHFVTATVDDVNRITESIEDNNAMAVPFTVFAARYAINSGGGAVGSFAADSNFVGSTNTLSVTNAIDVSGPANAAPVTVYQSERWDEFTYVLNNLAPGSNYLVRLHLAEISPSVNAVGDRRFNVSVNGVQVLYDLDVLAAAGGKFRAITREIQKRADQSGKLVVQFSLGASGQPQCNGLEVLAAADASQPPQISSLGVANNAAILAWPSSPGTIYQVQYKNGLMDSNWTVLGNNLLADASTLSVTNSLGGIATRFYRIVQIP